MGNDCSAQANGLRGVVFDIQRFSIHDGPGIRTAVFLKGCLLHCAWCSNPESISRTPELGVNRDCCDNCRKCVAACPEKTITVAGDKDVRIDRDRCNACGKCVLVCNPGALTLFGKEMTIEEVLKEVCRDRIFYQGSGGGVTVTGGEALVQHEFVIGLLQACRDVGIHTCIETSGHVSREVLSRALPFIDYVLYDIKTMDSDIHARYTGSSNDTILSNARVVAESGSTMLVRIPLIPGVNDSVENVSRTAQFVKTLGKDIGIELLPYHRMGQGKYKALDKAYSLSDLKPPDPAHLASLRQVIEDAGVAAIA